MSTNKDLFEFPQITTASLEEKWFDFYVRSQEEHEL